VRERAGGLGREPFSLVNRRDGSRSIWGSESDSSVAVLGSQCSEAGRRRAGAASAAPSLIPFNKGDHTHLAQVRAQYIDLNGNRDELTATLYLVNSSLTKSLALDEIDALGLDGVNEVLASDTAVNGVVIPPFGTFKLSVDSSNFPGLQPNLEIGYRGLESVVVT